MPYPQKGIYQWDKAKTAALPTPHGPKETAGVVGGREAPVLAYTGQKNKEDSVVNEFLWANTLPSADR